MATVIAQKYPVDSGDLVGLIITTDHDISTTPIKVGFFDRVVESPTRATSETAWFDPDYRVNSPDGKTVEVRVLKAPVDEGGTVQLEVGSWRPWAWIQDDQPEEPLVASPDYFKVV